MPYIAPRHSLSQYGVPSPAKAGTTIKDSSLEKKAFSSVSAAFSTKFNPSLSH